MANRAEEADRRRDDFHLDYGSVRDFEVNVLRECIVATHRFLSEIASEISADAALDAFAKDVFGGEVPQGGWQEKLNHHDGDLYSDLRMGQVFHDLNAYAHNGVALISGATPEERRDYIRGLIEGAEAFGALIPFKEWGIEGGRATMERVPVS